MVQVRVEQGDIARVASKALIVNLFEGVTYPGGSTGAVDQALGGAITKLIADGDITATCSSACNSASGSTVTVAVKGNFQLVTPILSAIFGGQTVKLHTGAGTDSATDLYWNYTVKPAWEKIDKLTLHNSENVEVFISEAKR